MRNIDDEKKSVFGRDRWRCQYPGCTAPATSLAHRIAQTKANIRKYGKEVIHHPKNMVSVCSDLRHNSYFNIGYKPKIADELAIEIRNTIAGEALYETIRTNP